MNAHDIFNLFLIISALHGFAFSFFLLLSKYGKDKSMVFLNLMILSISLNNFQSWTLANNLFQHKFLIDYIQFPWHFLSAPFFYMFLVHYLNIADKAVKILKLIIPVFILTCVLQVIFVFLMKDSGTHAELDFIYEKYTSIEEVLSIISSITIFSYAFYILYKKEKLFPKILSLDNLKWIYNFFKLLILVYIFWFAALVIKFQLNFSGFLVSYYPLRIFTTIIIYILGFQGLRHLRILKERKHIRETDQKKAALNSSKRLVIEQIKTMDPQFLMVDDFIRTEKKFLSPKYRLQDLADDINLGSSSLSLLINTYAQKSFIDYINEMRVAQAKKLLVDRQFEQYTIVSIGLESGFNSKSTFYSVFKKHVGCTPLAFKNNNIR